MAPQLCLKTVMPSNTFFNCASGRNLLDGHRQPLLVTDFRIAFSNKRWLHFFMLFVPVTACG